MSVINRVSAPDFDRLVDKAEACKLLSASFPTLWRAMKEGRLAPGRYIGQRLHWKLSELEAYRDGLPNEFIPRTINGRPNPAYKVKAEPATG